MGRYSLTFTSALAGYRPTIIRSFTPQTGQLHNWANPAPPNFADHLIFQFHSLVHNIFGKYRVVTVTACVVPFLEHDRSGTMKQSLSRLSVWLECSRKLWCAFTVNRSTHTLPCDQLRDTPPYNVQSAAHTLLWPTARHTTLQRPQSAAHTLLWPTARHTTLQRPQSAAHTLSPVTNCETHHLTTSTLSCTHTLSCDQLRDTPPYNVHSQLHGCQLFPYRV
jgi:hypothetical protein